MRRVVSLLLAAVLLLAALYLPGAARLRADAAAAVKAAAELRSGTEDMPKLTVSKMRSLLWNTSTATPSSVYVTEPSFSDPYAPGQVKKAVLQQTADRLNLLRAIAGLQPVALDQELCDSAQYGAVLLASSDFSHYPAQPADMDDSFYALGRAATSSSNIYAGLGLCRTPDGFMDDSDSYNIQALGHRRWQLNPYMGKVGFGYAVNPSAPYTYYTAEKVFDRSGNPADFQFIGWPASGNFPGWMLYNSAWSISVNPEHYRLKAAAQIQVSLTRVSDGKSWSFSLADCTKEDMSLGRFYVNTGGYGIPNCIIFRPETGLEYTGKYTVCVKGITDLAGKDVDFSYTVNFFDPHVLYTVTDQKAPTCTAVGSQTGYCSHCGKKVTVTVPALGHNYKNGICTRCGNEDPDYEPASLEAPTVTASNVASTGKVKLTWTAVPFAQSYQIYRSATKTGGYNLMKTTNSLSYVNTSAKSGETWYYKVRAVRGTLKSAYCQPILRTCDLPRPTVTGTHNKDTGKNKLTWTAVDGAVGYEVYRSNAEKGSYKLLKTVAKTSFTNTSTQPGQVWYYRVRALGEKTAANSADSAVKKLTCDLPRPVVTASRNSKGQPTLSWKAIDGAVSYKVYRAASENGSYTLMKTATKTSYTNTSYTAGKTYYYKVKAVHAVSAASSADSLPVSVTAK